MHSVLRFAALRAAPWSLAALLLLKAVPSAALPIGNFGTIAGARAGVGSMPLVGGALTREAEISRSDSFGNGAAAHAVLRDGALHALADSNHSNQPDTCPSVPSTCLPSAASAQVEFWDILTFSRSDLADPSQIRWRFDIHGFETNGPRHGGSAGARFTFQVNAVNGWAPTPLFAVNDGDIIRGSFAMTGETLTLRVYAGLEVNALGGGSADYSNTARFFLELPQGVTFTSRSGQFLADRPPMAPVPEPHAGALALAGAATLAWLRRRRGPIAG